MMPGSALVAQGLHACTLQRWDIAAGADPGAVPRVEALGVLSGE